MSYDLVIYTEKCNTMPALDYLRSVHDALRRSLTTCGAWFELNTHESRGADAKWFLENDGLLDPDYKRVFELFCEQHQINSEPLTEETALSFMMHQEGAHLAIVTLPADGVSCAAVFRALVEFARTRGLRLSDPQAGHDVDLERPGDYPPFWK